MKDLGSWKSLADRSNFSSIPNPYFLALGWLFYYAWRLDNLEVFHTYFSDVLSQTPYLFMLRADQRR